ncbi:MAG: cupin domain-containing protein [Cyclobacteriaceae bacterium]|nr:cupin domain-containing protein [Cyclobacteriaceae bacterium]
MAFVNKTIVNSRTGQQYRFIHTAQSTKGKLLEMESTFSPKSKIPPDHYHPYQTEDFIVLEGELIVKMEGQIKILKEGDSLHVPAKKIHSMWNESDGITKVNWKTQPALNTENLFETICGLANEGETNADGIPNILQTALTINKFSSVFRPAKPPIVILRVLFYLLTPLAYVMGYKPVYKEHLD